MTPDQIKDFQETIGCKGFQLCACHGCTDKLTCRGEQMLEAARKEFESYTPN